MERRSRLHVSGLLALAGLELLLILILAAAAWGGVTQVWVKRYNGPGNDVDYARAISVDRFGNVYVTGESWGDGTDFDYATVKYSPTGTLLWARRYNGPGNSVDKPHALALDFFGNVYVTGESWGEGSIDYATIKYNSAGDVKWVRRYDGPVEGADYARALAVNFINGDVYVTGESYGGPIKGFNYATVKYNSSGDRQWVSRFNASCNKTDDATAIALSGTNVYVTGGSIGALSDYDYTTVKYDTSSGAQLWTAPRRYNGPGNDVDYARAMAVDSDGNVYVTGESANSSNYDYALVKYSPTGAFLWGRRYDGPGNANDKAKAIKVDSEGNVYITGESWGGSSGYDYATIKYNTDGVHQWTKRYDGPVSGSDYGRALAVDSGGNVYVTGRSFGGAAKGYNYFTIKYGPDGTALWWKRFDALSGNDDDATAIAVRGDYVYVTGGSIGGASDFDFATIKYYQTP